MSLGPEYSTKMPRIRLCSVYILVLFSLLVATATSVDFHGQRRYRLESSGDDENAFDHESADQDPALPIVYISSAPLGYISTRKVVKNDATSTNKVVENDATSTSKVVENDATSTSKVVENDATSTSKVVKNDATSTSKVVENDATSTSKVVKNDATSTSKVVENDATSTNIVVENDATSTSKVVENDATSTSKVVENDATSTSKVVENDATSTSKVVENDATSTSKVVKDDDTLTWDVVIHTTSASNESSDSMLTRTTVNSMELISPTTMDTCKDFCEDAAQNLTATCYVNSAYVQFARPSTSYTISSYTLQVNNDTYYTIIENGDNLLTYNITNLKSHTLFQFMVNAVYDNSSSPLGTVNCTTVFESTELHWFTIAGCGISIFWLIVSLVCFCSLRRLQGPRNTFHVNLGVNLMIADGTILASMFYGLQLKSSNAETVLGIPCLVIPIVIHYFYFTSLMWMGLEILFIYRSLVVVFIKPNRPLLLTYAIGYFLPACIIAFCMLLNYLYFNVGNIYGSNRSCWIVGSNEVALMLLAFVLLVLLFNIIMFTLSSRAIVSIKARQESRFMVIIAKRSSKWLCHVLILHPFLGGSWLLGFLQFGQWKIAPLLFAVFVSLQSFFIFLMHCLLDSCIQQQMIHEDCRSSKAIEMRNITPHVDHISLTPVIPDQSDCTVFPPPYTLVITGDGNPFEHQDLLPKKRRSLKGLKYSWNLSPTRASVNRDNDTNGTTQFAGATFKPTEDSTLL